jgi:hypothetical protein
MTDLHETSDPKYTAQIDTVGWIFIAFAVVITAHRCDSGLPWERNYDRE